MLTAGDNKQNLYATNMLLEFLQCPPPPLGLKMPPTCLIILT